MSAVAAAVAGVVACLVATATGSHILSQPALARENHRGARIPTAAGLLLVAALIGLSGLRVLAWVAGLADEPMTPAWLLVLIAVVGFGFLGLLDDLVGDGHERGLTGHVRAALGGRVTTGFVKLAGGAALALVLAAGAAGLAGSSRPRVVLDAALIALAANLANLFDRAPGRAVKVALVAVVPLALVAGTTAAGVALGALAGAAAGLLWGDLRERFMLGDTGANALGAGIGVAAVLALGPTARTVTLAALAGLTLLSEIVSFSRIIAAVPPLRVIDRLGQR